MQRIIKNYKRRYIKYCCHFLESSKVNGFRVKISTKSSLWTKEQSAFFEPLQCLAFSTSLVLSPSPCWRCWESPFSFPAQRTGAWLHPQLSQEEAESYTVFPVKEPTKVHGGAQEVSLLSVLWWSSTKRNEFYSLGFAFLVDSWKNCLRGL